MHTASIGHVFQQFSDLSGIFMYRIVNQQARSKAFERLPNSRASRVLMAVMAVLTTAALQTAFAAEPASRPNIIIIMADDMGFSDIGCYGSEIETPNLDQLASHGLRFTQFYNTSRCCPTRASLLTGLYPHQAGVGHMMNDRKLPGYRGDLNDSCVTIAQALKPAGYKTYMSGKWHVTKHVQPDLSEEMKSNWPRQRGFDRFFGTIHGAGSFFDPNSLTLDNTQIPPTKDFYYTDAISDYASKFIQEHEGDSPFFMYVAYTAPHWPMHAKPQDIEKYKGRYDAGWDQLRQTRHARQKEIGLIDPKWQITERDPAAPAWEDAEFKDWHARRMEVYAAMVDCLDQGVGRIVKTLKEQGEFENTLILFLADNGGCAEEFGSNGEERTAKKNPPPIGPDELQTSMVPPITRDGKPVRQGRGVMPGPADTYVAYGLPWANASNTPFRRYKHWVHEGGISSPLIVHWPQGVDQKLHGKFYSQPAHLIDLMATCVDLSEADYPETYQGEKITPMQGVSLQPSFSGKDLNRTEPLFWEHEGNRAIRMGKWKLVAKGATGPWGLYDLEADRTETNDLAEQHPDRAKEMAAAWEAWAVKAQVKPWIWGK